MQENSGSKRMEDLASKWAEGVATAAEKEEFAAWFKEQANKEWQLSSSTAKTKEELEDELLQAIQARIEADKKTKVRWWPRVAAAVAVLIVAGTVWFLAGHKSNPGQTGTASVEAPGDVEAPARTRATLTLPDGRIIFLDSIEKGSIANIANVRIIKDAGDGIRYEGSAETTLYNVLQNPRGSQVVDVTLSDGTRVWLNAGSSLRYPLAFIGDERKVSITGEAYFEVAPSISSNGAEKRSFIVEKGDMSVKVLGTHFNVNAYDDENDLRVTLLEGSVIVALGQDKNAKLKPGEQAVIKGDEQIAINKLVNEDQVMAWKNGLFSFSSADLRTVMRQLARWYDLDVSYEGNLPERRFKGEISKDLTLSQILNGLSSTRIHFRLEPDHKITILPD